MDDEEEKRREEELFQEELNRNFNMMCSNKDDNTSLGCLGTCIAILFFVIVMVVCVSSNQENDNNENMSNEIPLEENEILVENIDNINNVVIQEKNEYTIDYNSEKDFETDIINGKDCVGKIVKFSVKKYAPNSAYGYNCQSGEHLNFISNDDINANKYDEIIGKITKVEKNFLKLWIIHYEYIDKIIKTDEEIKTLDELEKNKINFPKIDTFENYEKAETILKEAGFTNIKKEAIKDLEKNSWFVKDGEIKSIYINGYDVMSITYSPSKDDLFEKDVEILIKYHTYK